MNNTQRESAAKYAYDISKALVIAAIFTAVTDTGFEQAMQLGASAALIFFIGWRLEA